MTQVEPNEKPMQVVVRALSVLTCLAENPHGLTLHQVHLKLGIPLASMYRIVATLEHEDFVSRSPATKRFTLGPSAHRLGRTADYTAHLVEPPAPLIDLGSATRETVFLTQLIDSKVVCVALVESPHHLRLFVRVGQEMPLRAAASARAILAYRDPVLVEALLSSAPRDPFIESSPRDASDLIDHLSLIRERGFDICDNELDDNVWAVGAPVFDASGRVEYAVTLAAASARMQSPESRAHAAIEVLSTAERLSANLGFSGARRERTETEVADVIERHADVAALGKGSR
ncbi:IclR family transcriptional regulator [Leifsonia poae]|uniref:IclR family transcriptional regulator n=1 Tax=Leifsonia poae TaxID=110933 RepID=UPI001CBD7E5C|nr:IclR family transcriptional regulator [Leifsonia poae]